MKKLFFVKLIVFLVVSICTVVNAEPITSTQNPQKDVLPVEITQNKGEELSNTKLDLIIEKIENQDKQLDKSNDSNGVAIIVALIAAFVTIIGSIMTYISNKKTRDSAEESSKSSNDVFEKISIVESKTQDKQRLVEVISSQRVEWINSIRILFAEFNTNSYKFTSAIRQMEVQKIKPSSETNLLIPMLIHNIEMLELYLNPTEVVSKKLIKVCNSIINELSDATIKMASPYNGEIWIDLEKNYNSRKSDLLYLQQVILKSEWKRVKAETNNGNQLSKKQILQIFIQVAESLDSKRYTTFLKKELEDNFKETECEEYFMAEFTQTNDTEQNEFISNLLKQTSEDDNALKKFVDENLFPMNAKGKGDETINNNINTLKTMNPNQQLLVKARAKHFEETNDPSKYFPSLAAFTVSLIPVYALLNSFAGDDSFHRIMILTNIILFVLVISFFLKKYFHTVRLRSTAVYFNSLVTNIKYNDEKEK